MIKQVYAFKSHMEEAFLEGKRFPVTCFILPRHQITKTRIDKKSGATYLTAIGEKKATTKKTLLGSLKKIELSFTPKLFREIPVESEASAGEVDLNSLLVAGKTVQISAVSKGKGFSGVIKRHGFSTQPRTHGQSDRHRAPGSIARGTTPGRIVKGKKMAGRMGNDQKTIKNLKILSYTPETKTLKIIGPTPGARNSLTKIILSK
jgi:large subunit ribosomal protein L3